VEVRASNIDRTGCFAGEAIPAGAVFGEYVGERISQAEALRREADASRPAIFTLWLDNGEAIDGYVGGNETIYLNHSCEPNCDILEEEDGRVYFAAGRDIAAGEELTIDYAYDADVPPEPCRCGAPTCRGTINVAE
jgi:SET domain-containing protein